MLDEKFKVYLELKVVSDHVTYCGVDITNPVTGRFLTTITIDKTDLDKMKEQSFAIESVLILDAIRRGKT